MLGGRHDGTDVNAIRSGRVDTSIELDSYIERLLDKLGISRAELARALDVSERSIKRWQAGKSFPQYESRARLDELNLLVDRLLASFPDVAAAHAWLRAPNASSDGRSLVDAITMDRFDLVHLALDRRTAEGTR
jgi:transcriptional regulator with XRE-family HTH domain